MIPETSAAAKADIAFARSSFDVSCSGLVAAAGGKCVLTIDAREFSAPIDADGTAIIKVKFADLKDLATLESKLIAQAAGGASYPIEVPTLLRQVDVRTSKEFLDRVQSLRLRIQDPNAIRLCCQRRLQDPENSGEDRAMVLTIWGYRVVEAGDPTDPDIKQVRSHALKVLQEVVRGERSARWITSLTMMMTYLSILREDAKEVERYLVETLSYRPFLPVLSLLHTNFSRANLLYAIMAAAKGKLNASLGALSDVDVVYRTGVSSSWIDHPVKGRNQFSEIVAVLKSARGAHQLRDAFTRAGEDGLYEAAVAVPLAPISPIVRDLQRAGHWEAVLAKYARRPAKELSNG